MASKHKLIFACGGQGGDSIANVTAGWSVVFYLNALADSGSIALGPATRMKDYLRGMMSNKYGVNLVRIQQVDTEGAPSRRTFVYSVPTGARAGLIPEDPDIPGTEASDSFDALNIRLQTVEGPHRSFLFRGLPDGITQGGGAYTPSGTFNAAFQIFRAAMLNNTDFWSMRQQIGGTSYALTDVDVSTSLLSASPKITLFAPAGSFVAGDSIRIGPSPNFPGLAGLWRVRQIVADVANAVVLTLLPKRGKSVGIALANLLPTYARKVTFVLLNLADAQPLYGTHKLTGRPFGLQRGRRKKPV